MEQQNRDSWKGLAAGLAGGLIASVVMNKFQQFVGERVAGVNKSHGAQSLQQGTPREASGDDDARDDATERLASTIAHGVSGHKLTKDQKDTAGTVLHYAYGIGMGAFYGVAAEWMPLVTAGSGLAYGGAIWIAADEFIVPAFGLSQSADEYPLPIHAYALSSHFVYGFTTEIVRRAVRKAL